MNLLSVYKGLRPVLRPFGTPYSLLMRTRRSLYGAGRLDSYTPECPCVSIGNIAWGGTGKTPFVAWLLRWAAQEGLKAVVLSRGYGGKPGKEPLLVTPTTLPEHCGDEPLMLARAFPEAGVLVFPRRAQSARFAEAFLKPDLLVLDDGMQHLGVGRDLDIVLLRKDDLEDDWGRVIPAGVWREGESALAAASAFAVKVAPEEAVSLAPQIHARLARFGKPVFSFFPIPAGVRRLFGNGEGGNGLVPAEEFPTGPYILLSGVGHPEGVEESAKRLFGRAPVQHFSFADHHPYSASDIQAVLKMTAVPLPLVCTSKDAVKLSAFAELLHNTPVWVLESELTFGPSLFTDESFAGWWARRLAELVAAGRQA